MPDFTKETRHPLDPRQTLGSSSGHLSFPPSAPVPSGNLWAICSTIEQRNQQLFDHANALCAICNRLFGGDDTLVADAPMSKDSTVLTQIDRQLERQTFLLDSIAVSIKQISGL